MTGNEKGTKIKTTTESFKDRAMDVIDMDERQDVCYVMIERNIVAVFRRCDSIRIIIIILYIYIIYIWIDQSG